MICAPFSDSKKVACIMFESIRALETCCAWRVVGACRGLAWVLDGLSKTVGTFCVLGICMDIHGD